MSRSYTVVVLDVEHSTRSDGSLEILIPTNEGDVLTLTDLRNSLMDNAGLRSSQADEVCQLVRDMSVGNYLVERMAKD